MNKVSIILPIYNVEKYLEKCVNSVINQTYQNIEIILVDDGSKDSSGRICDELVESDNRIKVIHKKNGGLASARNAGYEMATGEYIMYIDSDDVIKNDIAEKCVSAMEKKRSDVVIFGYEKMAEDGQVLEICKWSNKTYNHDEMVEYLYEAICNMSFGYAWNKMYRKSTIDKSKVFGDAKVIDREDLVYNLELLRFWDRITYIDSVGYEYLQRSSSLLHNSDLARLKGVEYFVKRVEKINIGNAEVERKVFNMMVLHYLSDCIIKNILWNDELSAKEKKKLMKEAMEKCPCQEKLYQDKDNGKHLQMLYKSMASGKMGYFYWYVKLGDWKRGILNV